ncbi:MAG: beta-ketoacyl synthase N-terminal-like domain-containing protein, partial [Planctomycetota bacterium]|nr:beta-ketoacyl synthase N-terminal-like domain-containing protein [Planctomycetota bacterium]
MAHPGTQPLAIIGIGCLFPKANSLDAYWSNIKNRVDAITDVPETHWRPEDYYDRDPAAPDRTYVRRGGFLTPVDFDPMSFGIPPKAIEATDTSQLLGVYVARQTLEDAGYGSGRAFDRSRVSVVLGVTGALELVIPLGARLGHPIWRRALAESGIEGSVADDIVKRISAGYVPWQEDSFPGLLGNVVAGRIANRLDLGGTNCVVDAACASSLSALHLASLELAAGRCDMAICGGVDSFNDIFMFMCFSKTHTLSATGSAKPFDQDADGTIIGEGVGMVAIRRLDDAIADGDHIYAVVRGIGASSDGKGNAVYAPSAEGQMRALRDGYRIAGITPDTIELVEAHGTGTSVGDGVEHAALSQVYRATRRNGRWCALGSVKSQIGHTKAASGAAGLIKAVLSLKHKVLPPTINVNRPLPAIASDSSPFYLNIEKRPWVARPDYPRRAAVSSFGFGGSNFHCVLEEHEASKEAIDWDGAVQILAFSAKSSGDLSARLDLTIDDWDDLREKAALSRASFDPADLCRLLIVAERGGTDLQELFTDARKMLSRQPDATSWSTPNGIYFGSGDPDGLLGFLFPGQGSQYVGMLRDLACQFPRMLEILGEADRAFEDQRRGGAELSDLIYPQPAFDEEDRRRDEAALRATEAAQPAIGAVSLGALRILDQFGVRPDAAAGHSYGELTALCAAGRFDAAALHALSNLRGQLMANDNGDAGSMLAVQAPLGKVEEILRESGLELVIANKNAPTQAVLSGSTSQIEKAAEVFGRHQIPSKRLPVAAAFHSPSVAKARKPFEAALEGISFAQARIAVYANTSARVYPENAESARTLLAGQLANPVEFVEEIEEMVRNGVRTFLEVGPGARLSHLVQSILEGQEHHSMALDASGGKRSGIFDLAVVLARIASMGRKVDLGLWDAEFAAAAASGPSSEKPGMTVRIGGANTFVPKPVAARPASEKMPRLPALEKNAALLAASPSSSPSSSSGKEEALKLLHEHMAALQNIQDQTAQLHKQFLDGQDAAQRSIQALVEQQLIMTGGPPSPQPSAAASAPKEPIPIETPIETPIVKTDVGPPPISAPAVTPAPGPPSPQPSAEASAPKPPGGIAEVLLEVVAEKTGYPAEMLELNMDLDADLGIDSIKRVEILSALRERLPEAPSVQPEHLGSLHSLGDIVDFLTEGGPPSLQPSAEASAPRPPVGIAEVLLEVVAEKTGYPAEMLELNMDLDADLGIDSIKRVEILS